MLVYLTSAYDGINIEYKDGFYLYKYPYSNFYPPLIPIYFESSFW